MELNNVEMMFVLSALSVMLIAIGYIMGRIDGKR